MPTAQRVIEIAQSQVGYQEGFSGGHWNNIEKYAAQVPGLEWANGQPWCDVFVAWVYEQAGVAGFPVTASCLTSVAGWKAQNRFSEYPAIAAQVLFGPGGGSHTAVVIAYDANTITTIGGNTNTNGSSEGDGVYVKVYQRRDSYVYGYGYPVFDEGIQSADPAWANQAPAPGGVNSGVVTPPPPPPAAPALPVVRLPHVLAAIPMDRAGATGVVHYGDPAGSLALEKGLAVVLARMGVTYPGPIDGSLGDNFVKYWQILQQKWGFRGADADGIPGWTTISRVAAESGLFTAINY